MFRRKSDVDKHVQDLLRKVKNEHERNLRCYHIASMYYKAQDFESAKKYVSMYLSVRDDSSLAHKLLGQCCEGLDVKDKALSAYMKSLELEPNQAELILKVCELLCDDIEFDHTLARYWVEKASSLFPHDPSVFRLKEKLLSANDSMTSNDLENLLHSELKARPTDVSVRIKMLNLYVDSKRTEQALNHAIEVESRQAHSTNLSWYQCIDHICAVYHKESPNKCDWEFYIQWLSALDRVCSLGLSETQGCDLTGSTEAIHRMDQILHFAINVACPHDMYKEFIRHTGAQLLFHITLLLLKRAKKQGNGVWKETKRMIAPLLLIASQDSVSLTRLDTSDLKDIIQKLVKVWINYSRCRIIQAGLILLSLVKESQTERAFIEKVFHFTVNNWKLQIFQKVFSSIEEHQHTSSYFLTSDSYIPQKIPSHNNYKPSLFVSDFENVYIASLHHLVWLGLQALQNSNSIVKCKISPSFHTTYFKNLQLRVSRLNNVGVETLNQLDIDTFLYAAVFCADASFEGQKVNGYFPPDRPPVLPADICSPLCSVEQSKWWYGACSITKSGDFLNQGKNSMSELRHLLQRGIEIVRGENIPLSLITNIARTFSLRAAAADIERIEEGEACAARAVHLWQLAIPQLERLADGQPLTKYQKSTRFFDYPMKDLESHEVTSLLEEARYTVGCYLMKTEKYEEAIGFFKHLNTAQAAFQQALIYLKLAEQHVTNGYFGGEVTSEMRCNQAVMATKARDALFRARDMIKDNHEHPLYHKIKNKLLEVNGLLSRIESHKSTNANRSSLGNKDDSNLSCESGGSRSNSSGESGGSPVHIASNTRANDSHRFIHATSTPNRHYGSKRNNWPELMEILTMQQNTTQLKMQQILEHVKLSLEKVDSVVFELRNHKSMIEDLSNKFAAMETETKSALVEIKREVKRPDLYNIIEDEEYPDEMLQFHQNYAHYYPTPQQRPVGPSSGTVPYGSSAAAAAVTPYFSPRVEPVYQGNVGFYNQGALPFTDSQQLPDFLRTVQPKLSGALNTPQGIALGLAVAGTSSTPSAVGGLSTVNRLPTATFHGGSATFGCDSNRVLPTNVVITTSDTLPKGTPPIQPTLSVTIPRQHRLGDLYASSTMSTSISAGSTFSGSGNVPHQFQIHLPLQPQKPQETTQYPKPIINDVESEDDVATSESTNQESDSASDFKPFTPPIAKEVHVFPAGEEGEPIFSGRAKLFHFIDKSWKEKGIGELKLFKDKTNNKYRLVMRRDKVLTLCANHYVTPDMTLLPMTTGAGATWCWTANDFANGVTNVVKLCAKFKTVEDGQKFKDSFDKLKAELSSTCVKDQGKVDSIKMAVVTIAPFATIPTETTSPTATSTWFGGTAPTTSTTTASTTNKIIAGGFSFISPPKFQIPDEVQNVNKPKRAETQSKTESPFAFLNKPAHSTTPATVVDSPESTMPYISNSFFSNVLPAKNLQSSGSSPCSTNAQNSFSREGNVDPLSENSELFKFNLNSRTFGYSVNTQPSSDSGVSKLQHSPFQGAGAKVFGGGDSDRTPGSKCSADTSQNATGDDEFVPTAVFEPVVPLPELVQVVSGEEGEIALFEERAKLYRFCKETKQWKERGVGKMKLLKNEKTGVVRLVMRREQVYKVCCNHRLTKDLQLQPSTTSDRSYNWAAVDFSEEDKPEGVDEIFTLKLKNQQQALAFKEAFEKAQSECADISSSPTKSKETQEPVAPLKANYSTGTWECTGCYVYNSPQTQKCPACGTTKPGVTSSTAGDKDSTSVAPPFGGGFTFGFPSQKPAAEKQDKQSSLSWFTSRPAGSWICTSCYVQNKEEDTACVACQKTSNSSGVESSVFSKNSVDSSKMSGGLFVGQMSSLRGSQSNPVLQQPTPSPFVSDGFVFGYPPNNSKETGSTVEEKGTKPVFNFGGTSLSDTQLCKSSFNFTLNTSAPLASSTSPNKHDSGSEQGDSDNEDNAHEVDVHFQPVVPLPNEVEVVTGEEDETVLYTHRAKLFRFDSSEHEWKERGIGDIKILKHSRSGKIRLLLRREPISKLSLNHYLTPDIVLRKKNEKSWLWVAKDFASGEIITEQFCLLFKTPHIAKDFKQAIDDAQRSLQEPDSVSLKTENRSSPESFDSDVVEVVYEQKVPEELRQKAESLMLPANFYLYLQAKPCSGCVGCEPEEEDEFKPIKATEASESTNKTDETIKQSSFLNSPKICLPSSEVDTKITSGRNQNAESFSGQGDCKTGKENAPFFTQPSFTTSPAGVNIFGGVSNQLNSGAQPFLAGTSFGGNVSKSQSNIFGGAAQFATEKPLQTSIFSGTPSKQLESIPPSDGLFANARQKLLFGGENGGSGDISKVNQSFGGSASQTPVVVGAQQASVKGDSGSGDQGKSSEPAQQPNSSTTFGGDPKFSFNRPNSTFGQPKLPPIGSETQVSGFPLSTDNMSSFSSLLASKPAQAFVNASEKNSIKWEGAGTSVFGGGLGGATGSWSQSKSCATTTAADNKQKQEVGRVGDHDDNDSGDDRNNTTDDGHDPYFAPVVDLPELIELKTGEEDEHLVFSERAKLYLYQPKTKEWKERGVGEMKILKHKQEPNVYRLLMRRDTVHKIVCNQRITADFHLNPMSTSTEAFCWMGMNMAQEYDKPQMENLSVKFKNKDLAQNFKKCIDTAIASQK